ncbi:MAG: class I SAM-dependent methyltransferase [Mangrovibacterium sp.]
MRNKTVIPVFVSQVNGVHGFDQLEIGRTGKSFPDREIGTKSRNSGFHSQNYMKETWQSFTLYIILNIEKMTTKEHYDYHLATFYSWMTGDFDRNVNEFVSFCEENNITPQHTASAIDLGAGNGIQTIALAKLGFKVTAIDFTEQLLAELREKARTLPVSVVNDDIRNLKTHAHLRPELIVCWGDTITHLESHSEIEQFFSDASGILSPKGKLVLSFRDYSKALHNTQRFIPVKSDANRILTCVLEYFEDKVRVTDLLHELENDRWKQKTSSYYKTRLSKETAIKLLESSWFRLLYEQQEGGIIKLIGEKYN